MKGFIKLFAIPFIAAFFFLVPVYSAEFNPATVEQLVSAIQTANGNNEDDVINLVPGMVYSITAGAGGGPFNDGVGDNGLPIIEPDDTSSITINGNSSTIQRDPATGPCDGMGVEFRIFQINPGADLTLTGLTIQNGCAGGDGDTTDGGGIFNIGKITVNNSTFVSNTASVGGGAIFNEGYIPIITESTFIGNSTESDGGAISNNEGDIIEISNSIFNGNTTEGQGGAIFNDGKINTITLSTFSGNTADVAGGAIFNDFIITTITQSSFSGNSTDEFGGAIFNETTLSTISHSTFFGNVSNMSGGAIYNEGDITITTIINSTFGKNKANVDGGAIGNFGVMNISFTTISNNESDDGGVIYNNIMATLKIKNSIVGDNTGDDCSNTGSVEASGVNMDTDGTCTGFTQVSSMALNLDPEGLQDNGGPTQTIALINPSSAINAVTDCTDLDMNPVTVDQRFFPRPSPPDGNCDIGAFELRQLPRSIPTLSQWGLMAMGAVLGLLAVLVMRRRQIAS